MQSIFPEIRRKRLVAAFIKLIRINSPSFSEGEMGRFLTKELRMLGFSVLQQRYDRSFNLIARKKGNVRDAQPLMLSAHMDTIEPTEGLRYAVQAGKIKSVGSTVLGADDKSAIAQILEAVRVVRETGVPHGDLEIVFTSAEEKGLTGARNLEFGKIRSRHALVLDSGGPVGRIVVAAPSHITYEMQVTGRSAHAGIEPERGISAIRVAAQIIAAVPDGRIDPVTTANIGVISGGTATNVVSKEAHIRGEMRSHDAETLKRVRGEIFGAARAAAKKAGAGLRITEQREYRSFRIRDDDPFLAFTGGIYRKCGIMPEFVVTGGGSDANEFSRHGITALNLSTGMQKVHSHEEYIALDDLVKGAGIIAEMIRTFPSFTGKKGDGHDKDSSHSAYCSFPRQRCIRSGSCDERKGRACYRAG